MIDIFETQMDKFKASDEVKFMKRNVSQRLGLRQTLRYDVVSMMWDECRYQQSYHLNKMSPWCAVGVLHIERNLSCLYMLFIVYAHVYRHLTKNKQWSWNIWLTLICTTNMRMDLNCHLSFRVRPSNLC